jgi:hypothetical protein
MTMKRVWFRLKAYARWVDEMKDASGLLRAFRRAARDAGWRDEQVDLVVGEASSGDLAHMLRILKWHVIDPDDAKGRT